MTTLSRLLVTGVVTGVVLVLVAGAAWVWLSSDGEQLDRDVDRLTSLGGVNGVEVDRSRIRRVLLDDEVAEREVTAVLEAFDDIGGPALRNDTVVEVGWISTDVFDLADTWESMVAAGDLGLRGWPWRARAVGRGVWIETTLGTPDRTGGLPPTPAEAARSVIPVLESLRAHGVPGELELVVAGTATNQLDLVAVQREALVDLDATLEQLRDLARAAPETGIVCDADGCGSG